MSYDSIKKGQKVQLEIDTGGTLSSKTRIDCFVIDSDFDRLTISYPASKAEYVHYFTEGTELKAFVYTYTGVIIVDSIVFDAPFDGRMVVEFNEQNRVLQRRKYLRMPFISDLYIAQEEGNYRVDTQDIGGGGVRFLSERRFEANQNLCVHLRLGKFESLVKASGIVLKKNFYRPNEYVLEFSKIEEKDRDKIVQKCIELEKEINNKY